MQKLKGGLFLFRSLHFCHDDDNLKGNYSVFQPGPYIYTCCSVNDSYLPKALERVQLIASAGSCDTAARSDPFRATTRVKDMSVKGRLAGWCVHVELLEKTFFRLCVFPVNAFLSWKTTTWEVWELFFGTRAAELTSYVPKTWRTKVNTGLMVRNFYQSHVLYRFLCSSRSLKCRKQLWTCCSNLLPKSEERLPTSGNGTVRGAREGGKGHKLTLAEKL